jgi:oligopeptide transport system permease protein
MKQKIERPGAKIIARLKKNNLALFGLFIILISVVISILAYAIMPDDSPMANEMHLELSTKKPLYSAMFFKVEKDPAPASVSFFDYIFYGKPDNYKFIPIESYQLTDSSVLIKETSEGAESYQTFLFRKLYPDGSLVSKEKLMDDHIVTKRFYLGTDRYGRDVLSRIILGTRVSLSVGFISVIISLIVGVLLGALAGFFRGKTDDMIGWFINVVWSLPSLLLVIAISFALGKGFWQVFIAIGLSMWVEVARMVRGQILSIREAEYIEAARALGFSNFRIIYRHILPNIAGPLLVVASANFASAILLEAGLSFLGFGAQPPMPTWGGMVKEHYGYIILDAAYLAIIPGLAIMLLVFAFNIFSIGLRDAFDMKSGNTNV